MKEQIATADRRRSLESRTCSPLGLRHFRQHRSHLFRLWRGGHGPDRHRFARTPEFSLFTLDTEFLFPETYNLMDQVEQKYGVTIERVYPLLHRRSRSGSWSGAVATARRSMLQREEGRATAAQAGRTAGLDHQHPPRSDNCPSRAGKIEWDDKFGLVKINPIADWNAKQVWQYIRAHDTPYNALHDRGYPSIGCTHCTRAVRPGEDPRAGRWSGSSKTECGLHIIQGQSNPPEADA
jgi:phosphoadenosine phosphosulfate reductase